jgi:rhodanese-related sulfurtransferase
MVRGHEIRGLAPFEHVAGALSGGIDAWRTDGRPTSSYPTASMDDVYAEAAAGSMPPLLDVRQPIEWRDDGVIAGARTIFVADLAGRLDELPRDRRITVACKAGGRAAITASLLDAAGFEVRLVAEGGQLGWPERCARLGAGGELGRDAGRERRAGPGRTPNVRPERQALLARTMASSSSSRIP